MEYGGFSSQEELQEWIDTTLRESDVLAHAALSRILALVRERRTHGEQE